MVQRLQRALIAILLLLASGCGGGSTGTDGGVSIRVVGTVKTTAGTPAAGVEITVKENGDSTTTESDGSYEIATIVNPGTLDLIIAKDGQEGQTSIEVPETKPTEALSVDLILDEASFDVAVVSVTVVQNNPEPKPTPGVTPSVQEYSIAGSLKTQSGVGIRDFGIAIEGASSRTKSDRQGAFRIKASDRTPILVISNKAHARRVSLGSIAANVSEVRVELVLSFDGGGGPSTSAAESRFKVSVKKRTQQ